MEANARHIRGSTRSCRTPLSRSTNPPRRLLTVAEKCIQNAYKMRPNFKTQILINSLTATYNFTTLKCTHFPGALPVLTVDNQILGTESHDARLKGAVDRCSFSLGKKARMRDKPVHSARPPSCANKTPTTVQNGTKRDDFQFSQNPTTLYQRLTTTPSAVVPFCLDLEGGAPRREGRARCPSAPRIRVHSCPWGLRLELGFGISPSSLH
jgi:hypothetical protein